MATPKKRSRSRSRRSSLRALLMRSHVSVATLAVTVKATPVWLS